MKEDDERALLWADVAPVLLDDSDLHNYARGGHQVSAEWHICKSRGFDFEEASLRLVHLVGILS